MNKFHWTCRYCGQSQRGENPPETHLRSCTSTQISRALLTVEIGSSTGVYHVTHIPPRIIRFKQAPFIFEYVNIAQWEKKTTVEKNLYKLLGKLHLWKIRGDWTEANKGEVC